VRRLEYIIDLLNLFSVLRTENDGSAVALDRVIARHKRVNFTQLMVLMVHAMMRPERYKKHALYTLKVGVKR